MIRGYWIAVLVWIGFCTGSFTPTSAGPSGRLLFWCSTKKRDLAMFMLMLRCGLRVEEVANLTLRSVDYGRNQIMMRCGKGAKDRIVFIKLV